MTPDGLGLGVVEVGVERGVVEVEVERELVEVGLGTVGVEVLESSSEFSSLLSDVLVGVEVGIRKVEVRVRVLVESRLH